jgi:hypothetical protein
MFHLYQLITDKDETLHYVHTIQGAVITFIGIGILIYVRKRKF